MRLPLDAKIYVAGHDSPLGHMLCRKLQVTGHRQVITRSSHELNLRNQLDVNLFFEQELPDYVFLVNDHTTGLMDHVMHPAEFLYGRLIGLSNVIHASYVYEVHKLLNVILTFENGALAGGRGSAATLGEADEDPSTESLLQMVTLGLCDRYRKQYSCDFVTALFQLSGQAQSDQTQPGWQLPAFTLTPSPGLTPGVSGTLHCADSVSDGLYALDPADACLFLMEHFSSGGPISVRSGIGSFLVP